MFVLKFAIFYFFVFNLQVISGEVSKDVGMTRFYKELGCKPKTQDKKLPSVYECPNDSPSTTKCFVKGKSYNIGDKIPSEKGSCQAACVCISSGVRAKVVCANVECPEHLNRPISVRNCHRVYSLDQCCSTGFLCYSEPAKGNSTSQADFGGSKVTYSSSAPFTCQVKDRQVIQEGSKHYPEDYPCSRCVCSQKFDGKFDSWCRDISCDTSLIFNKAVLDWCAPVFISTSRCCPIQFRCPHKEDKILPGKTAASGGAQCTFGKMKLNIGDKLSPNSSDEDCTCEIPPYVTCHTSSL